MLTSCCLPDLDQGICGEMKSVYPESVLEFCIHVGEFGKKALRSTACLDLLGGKRTLRVKKEEE